MDVQTIQNLNDDQLLASLGNQFENERRTSNIILLHLHEVDRRRLYAARGYPDLYVMLLKFYRLSETSANQRVKAIALMAEVPRVEERLQSAELNLSTLAMAQRQIRLQEKVTGRKLERERKIEIVEKIANKTQAQAQVELFRMLPETAENPRTTEKRISDTVTRFNLNLPDEVRDMLLRLKDLWSHVDPQMDYVEVIKRAAAIALAKEDPLRKSAMVKSKTHCATESVKRRVTVKTKRPTYYPVQLDLDLWARAEGQCEFVDLKTGVRCGCTSRLQRDHIIPVARGGVNELSNLKLHCRTHNLFRARKQFGNAKIDAEIAKRRSRRNKRAARRTGHPARQFHLFKSNRAEL